MYMCYSKQVPLKNQCDAWKDAGGIESNSKKNHTDAHIY